MKYSYNTDRMVCSSRIDVDIDENGVLRDAKIIGGCAGNTQGVCRLVRSDRRRRTSSVSFPASAAARRRPPAPISLPARSKKRWHRRNDAEETAAQ